MLLTVPAIVSKGEPAIITLDKSALFSLAAVQADPYFSNPANVRDVFVEFNSEPGNQRKILRFDLSEVTPTAKFLATAHAKDVFLLERILLVDFDEGTLAVERANLPSGLDISLIVQTYTGAYDNGRTYSPGESVTFGGNRWLMVVFIGAAGYVPTAPHWVDLGVEV